MEMYQDGVRVWNCIGYCSADVEKRNPAVDRRMSGRTNVL